jgi:general secretion pathway protein K
MRSNLQQPRAGDRGSVLVLALWAMIAGALGAAAIIAIGRVQQTLARNETDAFRQELVLQSAIHVAMHGLVTHPAEWVVDGGARSVVLGADRVSIAVADEAGKIDINVAADDLLLGLLGPSRIGDEQKRRLSAAIQDWRDRDDDRRSLGNEKPDYVARGHRYEPRNRPFANPAELQRVMGMSPEMYRQMASALTVYSQRAGVDSRVATPEVLRRLPGMDEAAVNGIVRARRTDGDLSGASTYVGRTISIRAALMGKPTTTAWTAVVRLAGNRREQLRIMAWHRTADSK